MSALHSISEGTKPQVRADVIFVHGLGGHYETTWESSPSHNILRWLDAAMPQVAIHSLSYDAAPTNWLGGHSMPIVDRAINVLATFDAAGIGGRPVIFVTHSLGGLLVKQILRTAHGYGESNWKRVLEKTRGIIFMATPHSGSRLADFLGNLRVSLRLPKIVGELEANASQLRDLNYWYRTNAPAFGIVSRVYFETRPTHGVMVVDEASADPGLPNVVPLPIDANHFEICKPPSQTSLVYVGLTRFIGDNVPAVDQGSAPRPGCGVSTSPLWADLTNRLSQESSRHIDPFGDAFANGWERLSGIELSGTHYRQPAERSALVDAAIRKAADESGIASTESVSLIARGGYGHGELSLGSDVDISVLHAPENTQDAEAFFRMMQIRLDRTLRLSVGLALAPIINTVSECEAAWRAAFLGDSGGTPTIASFAHCRHIAGTTKLSRLLERTWFDLMATASRRQLGHMIDSLRDRLAKELSDGSGPVNIKHGPGGIMEWRLSLFANKVLTARGHSSPAEAPDADAYAFLMALRDITYRITKSYLITAHSRNEILTEMASVSGVYNRAEVDEKLYVCLCSGRNYFRKRVKLLDKIMDMA